MSAVLAQAVSQVQGLNASSLFQCTWIEGGRTFNVVFGAVTALVCLAIAVPTLWWVLPGHRVWLFSPSVDPHQRLQLAYGLFAMAMAFTDSLCRFIPHRPLPAVHPAFFLTTVLIAAGLGPRVAFLDFTSSRSRSRGASAGDPQPAAGRKSPRLRSFALAALLAGVLAIPLVALWQAFGPKVTHAPDFSLVDQNGSPFVLSEQRGHPVVLFFGYTHCPDACPTTLAHLARAVHAAGAPDDVRVAFVTVDPERDTSAALKRYVRVFDPAFFGLTGTLKALEPVYAAYNTWRQAVPVQHGPDNYFMAHGTTIYYIGRNGAIKGLGNWDDSVAVIARDLKEFQ